jgi:hypothetical protein
MYLSYDGIVFDVLLLNAWQQDSVMSEDGVDFLYWHHLIDVTCILNPAVTNAQLFPDPEFDGRANRQQRREEQEEENWLDIVLRQAKEAGVLEKGAATMESPLKTGIPIPESVSYDKPPVVTTTDTFYQDAVGNPSTKADGPGFYPPVTEMIPGVPYDKDVADKTGPTSEPVSAGWVNPNTRGLQPESLSNQKVILTGNPGKELPKESTDKNQFNEPEKPSIFRRAITSGAAGIGGLAASAALDNPDTTTKVLGSGAAGIGGAVAGSAIETGEALKEAGVTIDKLKEGFTLDVPGLFRQTVRDFFDGKLERPPTPPPFKVPKQKLDEPPPAGKRARRPVNGNMPATEVELRDRLQMPRRQLAIWINSGPNGAPEYMLLQPYPGCHSDAKHGPTCVNMHMVAIHGNVTGVKRLVFECFEALPLRYGEKHRLRVPGAEPKAAEKALLTPPIISNRWTMSQQPDPQTYLNSTVISGRAVFRLDVLHKLRLTPDQLRPYIMPPIPMGYIRQPPRVTQGSAGNEVLYEIVDEQQMMNNPSGAQWGVHSVVLVDTVQANMPIDVVRRTFRAQRS